MFAHENLLTLRNMTTPHNNRIPLPSGYNDWRQEIVHRIESAKFNAALHVNTDMLQL